MNMEGASPPSRDEDEKSMEYQELLKRLSELGIDIPVSKGEYSRASKSIKRLLLALLEKLEEALAAREKKGLRVSLSREDMEYIIYRLRTVYGDHRATSIVAKLSDALRRAG